MKKLLLLPLIAISLVATAQTTAIPDANFEQALINLGHDNVIDGGVLTANINTVLTLDVSYKGISDLTGIEDFTALTYLACHNNQLTFLNVSQNTYLTFLDCYNNQLTNLDVTQNTSLDSLVCSENQLTTIDVSQNTALTYLVFHYNQITNIDVSQNTALTYLYCHNNQLTNLDLSQNIALQQVDFTNNLLTNLDVSQNTDLEVLYCESNQLTSIEVAGATALDWLICGDNQITSLDVSQNTALRRLRCDNNNLHCLNVKNGNNPNFLLFDPTTNPNLNCIEVDDVAYSTSNWTWINSQTSFSTNCGNSCSGLAQDTCDYVDTTYVTVYDTVLAIVYDTTFVTIYDTVLTAVTDTLIMDVTLTGIPLPNNTNTMLVYPNPASDVVIIDNGDYLSMSGYTLKIINSLGQEVFNTAINIPVFSIPVSTLGSVGTYYIQVFDTSPNIVQTKALILQ
ncbi:MAG: T9SS type A sorting domain-containing protein [Flavobacteriales bacterium]|nr:T9SS type A sorting domain-containing protein [Flavobacteriales bacterium]